MNSQNTNPETLTPQLHTDSRPNPQQTNDSSIAMDLRISDEWIHLQEMLFEQHNNQPQSGYLKDSKNTTKERRIIWRSQTIDQVLEVSLTLLVD